MLDPSLLVKLPDGADAAKASVRFALAQTASKMLSSVPDAQTLGCTPW
jgi:hypothetical protein